MEQEKTLQENLEEIYRIINEYHENGYYKAFSDWRKQWLKDNTSQSLQKEV